MQTIAQVSYKRHGSKCWHRPNSFFFAAKNQFVPLAGSEVAAAVLSLPLCFVLKGEHFELSALLSPVPDDNFFVDPNGRWAGGYVPGHFKWHPFSLERIDGTDKRALCVDESSGLVSDGPGEKFFNDDRQLSRLPADVFARLVELEKSRAVTAKSVAALADAGLMKQWDLELEVADEAVQVNGVYRIDDAGLNALGDQALLTLCRTQSLPIAYAQLFSMPNTRHFDRLARIRKQMDGTRAKQEEIHKIFADDDIIKFN